MELPLFFFYKNLHVLPQSVNCCIRIREKIHRYFDQGDERKINEEEAGGKLGPMRPLSCCLVD
jgi:hypothetical protein